MKYFILLTAETLALMSATPAYATDWVYVEKDASNASHYYDRDSLSRNGNQVRFWQKVDYRRVPTDKRRESVTRVIYDCAERNYRIISNVDRYPDGKTDIVEFRPEQQFLTQTSIVPDSIAEALLEAVCSDN